MANSINNTSIGNGTTLTLPISNSTTGQIYVTNTGSYSTNQNKFTNSQGQAVLEIPNSETPSIKINGDIEWNGERLQDRLERIELLLNIPSRDVTMEEKYPKLKQLWNDYNKALAEYKTWETLKDSK